MRDCTPFSLNQKTVISGLVASMDETTIVPGRNHLNDCLSGLMKTSGEVDLLAGVLSKCLDQLIVYPSILGLGTSAKQHLSI